MLNKDAYAAYLNTWKAVESHRFEVYAAVDSVIRTVAETFGQSALFTWRFTNTNTNGVGYLPEVVFFSANPAEKVYFKCSINLAARTKYNNYAYCFPKVFLSMTKDEIVQYLEKEIADSRPRKRRRRSKWTG